MTAIQNIIVSNYDPSLCWSNHYGWVPASEGDVFSDLERSKINLPIGGRWERVADVELDDWRSADGSVAPNPLQLRISVQDDRVDLTTPDGRAIWIESENLTLRLHVYSSDEDEPLNIDVTTSSISTSRE